MPQPNRRRRVIELLYAPVQNVAHAIGRDCRVRSCGPCSFDRACPRAAARPDDTTGA